MKLLNQKEVKLTDKAFSRLVLTSVLGILVCIGGLCSSTWAWFSDNAPSNQNEIKTMDTCLLTVSVGENVVTSSEIEAPSKTEGAIEADPAESPDGAAATLLIEAADVENPATVTLQSGATYTVTLSLPKDSSSGYLVFSVGDDEKYYSDFLEHHDSEEAKTLTFTITVNSSEPIEVTFTPRWGIYAGDPTVTDGGSFTFD